MDHLASKVAEVITKWNSKKSILKLIKATTIMTVQDGETLKTSLHQSSGSQPGCRELVTGCRQSFQILDLYTY